MMNQFVGWVFASKEMSLDQKTSAIRDAFYHKFESNESAPIAKASSDVYVREVYPDYVIASRGGECFKVTYTVGENGVVFSDEMIPVEQVWREKVQ